MNDRTGRDPTPRRTAGLRLSTPPRGVEVITRGTVTSPRKFVAGAVHAGIKTVGFEPPDLGILASERDAALAAVFTRSTVKGAAVIISQRHARDGRGRGVIVNAGISNVATGKQGLEYAREMCALASRVLGCRDSDVLVGSTGVIGRPLPMDKIRRGAARLQVSRGGGHAFARAIMTTDTHPKTLAVRFRSEGREYRIGAVAKGSGMIHPDMATMFCFITTDASVERRFLRSSLRAAVDDSLNMISVDGDTSTSDTTAIFANGAAGGSTIKRSSRAGMAFSRALRYVCIEIARMLARDGEGAQKLIEVCVEGSASVSEARRAARTISASPLVKTAVHGNDPNWGRILMAVGRSYVRVNLDRARVWVGAVPVYNRGIIEFNKRSAAAELRREQVALRLDLGTGRASATAWGCDMTPEYVHINADYTT
jgi:glutamate N-acetyltransferase/amino-acid N-acetyltransferase